jgi:hypothetical protein
MERIIVAVPAGANYIPSFDTFAKSLHHFHPDLEVRRFDNPNPDDKDFWYRAKPIIAKQLFSEGFEKLILADADQIVLGSWEDILNDKTEFDVACVLNDPSFPIQCWDIAPYYNAGFVVLKSKAFAEHWLRLCYTDHFAKYQFREQDILNILASDYMNYKVKILDDIKVYGEWAKPLLTKSYLKDDKVYVPFNGKEIQLCIWHSGGGNTPDKGKYRLRFPPEVADWIDKLI